MSTDVMTLPAAERDAHQQQFGGFNDFPPGWREIDAATFACSDFFFYTPVREEHRQMFKRHPDGSIINEPAVCARLYFSHDNNGVAMVQIIERARPVGVRFFGFGCLHEEEQYVPGGLRCTQCGRERQRPDSSD